MVVVGHHITVIQKTGRQADVLAFVEEAGSLARVDIVDADIAYNCAIDGRTYLIVPRNALYVPSMDCNLPPPLRNA